MTTHHHDVIIVGGGPAGLATALHLARRYPALAARCLVLEAQPYPRRKVCGGALTLHGGEQLATLGLRLDVPAVQVDRVAFRYQRHSFALNWPAMMQIVQREAFDAALAVATQRAGVAVQSGVRLQALYPAPGGVELATTAGNYRARVVVAADGANSVVRRCLGLRDPIGIARLLRVLTPANPQTARPFTERTATFDFSCLAQGVQGYYWDFPCLIDGQPTINRGIFDSQVARRPRANLKAAFRDALAEREVLLDDLPLAGHPVRWFNPAAAFARPHVLLVGDAAGVDPLFAEGISFALEYGALAADTLAQACATGDFSFSGYRQRVLTSQLGRNLLFKRAIARRLYGWQHPLGWALLWWLTAASPLWAQQAVARALGVLPPTGQVPLSQSL